MKMLIWAADLTRLDKVPNQHNGSTFKIATIIGDLTESTIRRYGRLMRRPGDHEAWHALAIKEKISNYMVVSSNWRLETGAIHKNTTQETGRLRA
ncbi:hypothetical protein EVAR_14066_1 [Eumeta japonica]|uniref:Uncharacterized protein n=1 Tax=Eumeta variegata TaxID=151549 RepID=A0A4C1UP91_EUMVA|nr:hypothetical protein EVAR_14066_1 [Eumeta japonica]